MFKKLTGRVTSSTLAINSAIVFAGSMGANVASYLYHLLMGRLLGPAGYGEISSLLSILYILTIPILVGQTVLVKFVSAYKAHDEIGKAKSLFVDVTKLFIVVSLVGLPLVFLFAPTITDFLHLSSSTYVFILYLLFVFSLLTVATVSMLQGFQKFIWVSLIGASTIGIKLLLSIPLTSFGVLGALWAVVLSSVLVYLVCFIPLRFILKATLIPSAFNVNEALTFAVPTLLSLLGITSLYTTDIILTRHYFSPKEAGIYAAMAILGKVIFYTSSAISTVSFPVLSERATKGQSTRKFVLWSIAAVSVMSFGLVGVYFLIPDIIVRLLFGEAYHVPGNILGLFGLFLALFSISNIITMTSLALGKLNVWIFPIVGAFLQIIGIIFYHSSMLSVLYVNILICAILAIVLFVYYMKTAYEKV